MAIGRTRSNRCENAFAVRCRPAAWNSPDPSFHRPSPASTTPRARSMPAFIITIDTEGDNAWARPRSMTTANARYLPRFQSLCERYRLKPTYLTNYEMARCPAFQEFGHDVLQRGAAEIGMHL